MGSWAVHAERAPVRVSTGGRGGGALLERIRVGVPAQAGITRPVFWLGGGLLVAGLLFSYVAKMLEVPCLRSSCGGSKPSLLGFVSPILTVALMSGL